MVQTASSVLRRRSRSMLRLTLTVGIAAGISFSSIPLLASDNEYDSGGIFASSTPDPCGCDGLSSSFVKKRNPIYRTLDMLAGGIEKVLGLDKCHSKPHACDDVVFDLGCDSAPFQKSMIAMPQPIPTKAAQSYSVPPAPVVTPQQSMPQQSDGAPPSYQSTPPEAPVQSGQRSPMQMSEPRIQAPMPIQKQLPDKAEGKSLFDSLSDPFTDEARHSHKQIVRPSVYSAPVTRASNRRTSP